MLLYVYDGSLLVALFFGGIHLLLYPGSPGIGADDPFPDYSMDPVLVS